MSNRIVTPDGMIPGSDGQPDRAPTLKERLDSALDHWKMGRKAQGFTTSLNAIAYLSAGLAGMAKLTEVMRSENDVLRKRVDALEAKQQDKQP